MKQERISTATSMSKPQLGRKKQQTLKQCWFSGSHSDIGGGWQDHDLADLSLTWMVANIAPLLSMDLKYLASLPGPVCPWGEMQPHDPESGIFKFSGEITRKLPTATDDVTYETIHPSVLLQPTKTPALELALSHRVIGKLMPLEEELRANWPYKPSDPSAEAYQKRISADEKTPGLLGGALHVFGDVGHRLISSVTKSEAMHSQSGQPVYEQSWFSKMADETPFGVYTKALEEKF